MKKLKILIADDEEMIQDLYEMIIESVYKCETFKVSNGIDAIALLKEHQDFDLIISDYNMPKSKGGDIYIYNKAHQQLPFFLFSGGDLADYAEFTDFKLSDPMNFFFGKPFDDDGLLAAVKLVIESKKLSSEISSVSNDSNGEYIRVKLAYYSQHTQNAAEVYIKLSNDKYTKIITQNSPNIPDEDLLNHYLEKGIEYIFLRRDFFELFLKDVFNKFQQQIFRDRKATVNLSIGGFNFEVSVEGLKAVGVDEVVIEKVNEVLTETINSLLNNPSSKEQFKKLCEAEGMIVGHSMLIMYIAGRICRDSQLNFATSMRKITAAAFYHDLSLFDQDYVLDNVDIADIKNKEQLKILLDHPIYSASFLPDNFEIVDDTKKIILEHHELPNGKGYPKKLDASQISPLSCLFILSQQITYCLLRNNFSRERLQDFIKNSKGDYTQGNFAKFYSVAEKIF